MTVLRTDPSGSENGSATAPIGTPQVVAVGPWKDGEFAVVRPTLPGSQRWLDAADLDDAADKIASRSVPPEVALLAAPRPGYWQAEVALKLQRLAPLMRSVVVAGTWCEGELRTGQPLAGAARLYWYELPAWWQAAVDSYQQGLAPPWSAPDADRFAGPHINGASCSASARPVVVDAVDYDVFDALRTALEAWGWTALWQPRHRRRSWSESSLQPAAAIWDGSQLDASELAELAEFCSRAAVHSVQVVALLDYPRSEHFELARSAGATAILPKPYRVAAVVQTISAMRRE